ncbi:hypothetical protein LJR161_003666 [Variovorax paradoxus]|uniref:Magnetosome protein MamI n=1 Tax=Variovorax paradoxus TaxID=34073 RepID=A0AAW8EI55_VARPD|nr:hypothetical protein [Variovorax paradoxus]MDP9972518.1 hypothetical protein [Variovorax paradoxus]
MRLSTVGLVLAVIGAILANIGFVAFLGVAASISGGGGWHDLLPEPMMMGFLLGGPILFLLGVAISLGVKIKAALEKAKARRNAAAVSYSDPESPAS